MLIDDVTIKVKAGHGGKGMVTFNKNPGALGPTGGNGGRGGSVFFIGVSNLDALKQFRFKKILEAEDGEMGKNQHKDGANGKDLVLEVPVGTVIHNLTTKEDIEILKLNERVLIAAGGKGGKGNYEFRSSTNTTPMQSQPGLPGDEFDLRLELKLIADIGFIGLPNAGKSSLLNELTNASVKVANYPFTTLEPNLGIYFDLILADIPGLIQGASSGKGLGIKFLRHIERTKILFHLISAESESASKDYKTIRGELKKYNPALLEKPEYLFLSKSDEVGEKEKEKKLKQLKKINENAIAISVYDDESLEQVKKILNKIISKKLNIACE
ncbi:MAG: GTPase ObgE [Candidatus Pacebacteria bacterium]|nr:GTPase ObgE [Candidatus Paceibacterota bacterium]